MNANDRINLRLPERDYARLCHLARVQRTTVSALVCVAVQSAPPRPNPGPSHRVSVRVPEPLAQAVQAKAEASGMTPTGFIRAAVQRLLEARG